MANETRELSGAEEQLQSTEYSILVKTVGKERADAIIADTEEVELDDELKDLLEDVEPLDEM